MRIAASLILSCCVALCANALVGQEQEYTVEFLGTVKCNGDAVEGATVVAQTDPLHGRHTKAQFAKEKEAGAKFPEVSASGTATADAKGDFRLVVTVKATGAEPETVNYGGTRCRVAHVIITITSSTTHRWVLCEKGIEHNPHNYRTIRLKPPNSITGKVVDTNGKPMVNVEVQVYGHMDSPTGELGEYFEFATKTDGSGAFVFVGTQLPGSYVALKPSDPKMAWDNPGRVQFHISGRANFGELVLVPGGTIKVRTLDKFSGAPLDATIAFERVQPFRVSIDNQASREGEYTSGMVAPGVYRVSAASAQGYHDEEGGEFEVVAGKVTQAPDLLFMPSLTLPVIVTSGGVGIERYSVQFEHVNGDVPGQHRKTIREGRRVWVRADLTAERCSVPNLFAGRWRMLAKHQDQVSAFVDVELPATEPLVVDVGPAAELSVTTLDLERREVQVPILVVLHNTPAWHALESGIPVEDVNRRSGLGVYPGTSGKGPVKSIPPGKYEVLGIQWNTLAYRTTVELKPGARESVTLNPVRGEIRVAVTQDGKAATGEPITLLSRVDRGYAALTRKTGADGLVVFDGLAPAEYSVVTQRELDWIGDLTSEERDLERKLTRLRKFQISYSSKKHVTLELNDKLRTFLQVELYLPLHATLGRCELRTGAGAIAMWGTVIPEMTAGDVLKFGPVGPGPWLLYLTLQMDRGRHVVTSVHPLNVSNSVAETLTVTPEFVEISGKVKIPAGYDARNTRISLVPVMGDLLSDGYASLAGTVVLADEKGNFKANDMPVGDYAVMASAFNATTRATIRAGRRINAGKSVRNIDIEFNPKSGNLEIAVAGKQTAWGNKYLRGKLRLFDSAGKEFVIPDPRQAYPLTEKALLVECVPAGTYSVELVVSGFHPMRQEGVKVAAGETNKLTFNGEPTAGFIASLMCYPPSTAPLVRQVKITFEDDNGVELKTDLQPHWRAKINWEGNGFRLDCYAAPKGTRCAKVSIPGYREALVELQGRAGEVEQPKVTLEEE